MAAAFREPSEAVNALRELLNGLRDPTNRLADCIHGAGEPVFSLMGRTHGLVGHKKGH
jgi:hypothetical protein